MEIPNKLTLLTNKHMGKQIQAHTNHRIETPQQVYKQTCDEYWLIDICKVGTGI